MCYCVALTFKLNITTYFTTVKNLYLTAFITIFSNFFLLDGTYLQLKNDSFDCFRSKV
jgi:hypothetical protein